MNQDDLNYLSTMLRVGEWTVVPGSTSASPDKVVVLTLPLSIRVSVRVSGKRLKVIPSQKKYLYTLLDKGLERLGVKTRRILGPKW